MITFPNFGKTLEHKTSSEVKKYLFPRQSLWANYAGVDCLKCTSNAGTAVQAGLGVGLNSEIT